MKTLRNKVAIILYTVSLAFSVFADKIARTKGNEDAEYTVYFFGHSGDYL